MISSRCFICSKCKRPQDDKLQIYVGLDNKIYCSAHYPKPTPLPMEVDTTKIMAKEGYGCPKCGGMVFDAEKMTIKAGVFHKLCFNCNLCGQALNYSNFTSYEKSVFCHGCFRKNFDKRSKSVGPPDLTSIKGSPSENCFKCGGIVFGIEKVQTRHHVLHRSCLNCQLCAKSLLPSNFFESDDDKIVCELCLASMRRRAKSVGPSNVTSIMVGPGDTKCLECGYKVFEMEKISVGSGSYHLSCYKCARCKCLLDSASANIGQSGQVFCNGCFTKVINTHDENNFVKSHVETTTIPAPEEDPDMCVRCWGKVFPPERRQARSGVYHKRCFSCEAVLNIFQII